MIIGLGISPSIAPVSGGSGFDADAQSFITAASITDETQQNAINQYVVDLKAFGVWTKLKTIYPFVGGNAAAHSFNLKDTTSFQMTWFGGMTHSANGVNGNGTNGYGATGYIEDIEGLDANNQYQALYSKTDYAASEVDCGSVDASSRRHIMALMLGTSWYGNMSDVSNITVTDSLGFHQTVRYTASDVYYQKETARTAKSVAVGGVSDIEDYICGFNNNGSLNQATSRVYSMFINGLNTALTTTNLDDIETANLAFQTALSREN